MATICTWPRKAAVCADSQLVSCCGTASIDPPKPVPATYAGADEGGNISEVGVRRVIAAVGAAAACAAAAGCTINVGTHTAPATAEVSKADLQKDISNRVAEAGQVAQSVTCPEDLVGEVGKTTRCTVTKSATSSYEVLVTVSSVEGSN